MNGDVIWVAVAAVFVEGDDDLRLNLSQHFDHAARNGFGVILPVVPQAAGVGVLVVAHHAAVFVAEFIDVLEPQDLSRAGEFCEAQIADAVVLALHFLWDGADIAICGANQVDIRAFVNQLWDDPA